MIRNIRQLSLAVLAWMSIAVPALAWDNNADAQLPQSSRRVVMMGNSITQYWQGHEVNNHKEFFTDNGALCRGVAGQKTTAMVSRFDADVVALKPLVVVIAGGVNDINGGSTADEVLANTKAMAEKAAAAGIRPILATINPSGWGKDTNNKYIDYNKKVKEYCDQQGYAFCNYFDVLTMGTVKGNFTYEGSYNEMKEEYRGRENHSDHLHPCRAGYLVMESVLIPLIEAQLWRNGIYEAEHAVKSGTDVKDAADNGAHGKSRVGYIGRGNTLSLGYNAAQAGKHVLTVVYATNSERRLAVTVNGQKQTVTCAASGGWDMQKSAEKVIEVTLQKGYNTIVVGDQDDDAPNIDFFRMAEGSIGDDTSELFYIYNVGAGLWVKTDGTTKQYDIPGLVPQAERTVSVLKKQDDGSYLICDPAYAPFGWGVQGRNIINESVNGSAKTNTWGSNLLPGFRLVATGDADGSVYIDYTWGQWTPGKAAIDDPSGKTYRLFYGDWALGTNGWPKDLDLVAAKAVWPDLKSNAATHGDYAKWIFVPVGGGTVNPDPAEVTTDTGLNEEDNDPVVEQYYAQVTIGSARQATYSSSSPLDFSDVDGLKAYVATGYNYATGNIMLTHVNQVPAGTGMLLKGEEGTYQVPVAACHWYYVNFFEPALVTMQVPATEGDYTNLYLTNGSSGVAFYHINGQVQISANHAYLHVPTAWTNSSRVMNMQFDDEATAISHLVDKTHGAEDSQYFDLQGRRVETPVQGGVYIRNGKKIVR